MEHSKARRLAHLGVLRNKHWIFFWRTKCKSFLSHARIAVRLFKSRMGLTNLLAHIAELKCMSSEGVALFRLNLSKRSAQVHLRLRQSWLLFALQKSVMRLQVG